MRRPWVWAIASCAICSFATASSLQYFGGRSRGDVDRVKIQIDNPDDANPGPPVDVGATDFTVEFFMKATPGANTMPETGCNQNAWTNGNIIIDRDRFGGERDYGISLGGGRVNFGVTGPGYAENTLCGMTRVDDGQWHHVAVERRRSDGRMYIFVDGRLDAQADGPDGDISYPDNAYPARACGANQYEYCLSSDPYLVIGTEKHNIAYGFAGMLDELRVSSVLRYPTSGYALPNVAFVADADTRALYHFDEGAGDIVIDSTSGNRSPGTRRFGQGGGSQSGPVWIADSPFAGGSPPPPPPPPPPPEDPVYKLRILSTGFQVRPVHLRNSDGSRGAQMRVGDVPVNVFVGDTNTLPICDANDTAFHSASGQTYMRVTAPAVCPYNHSVGQTVTGYVSPCDLQQP
jgi:hypothetical protein